jgi:hypothetical protein
MTTLDPQTNLPKKEEPSSLTKLRNVFTNPEVGFGAGEVSTSNIDFSKWQGVNRRVGADNEEIRAQSQTWWDLTKGATAQAAATVIGGSIEGTGYLLDLFNVPKMAKLMQGEDAEFGNILSEFGKGIQEYTREEIAPIYQTRAAQEGWALGDGTWWASNAPSLASTLSIMVPVFAARSAVMLGARTLNKSIRATKTGAKVLDDVADSGLVQRLNNRKINNFAEQAGLAFTSRHIENSMESASVYQDILDRKMSEGFSEDEAKQIAGESAAQTYRLGYMNMWQDVIQWNMLLKGSYANRAIAAGGKAGNKKVQDAVSKLREQYGDSGIIPSAALTKAGVNKKDILLNAFGEGFEEFNQNFIQNYGNDYADYLSGNTSKEPPKGFLESYFSRDFIDQATDKKAWDATFWGFLGGLVFGGAAKYGVFDKSVDFITRKNQMDNVNYMQREGAKFEYIKTLSNNILKYEAEGNIALRDANTDKLAMAITLGQIVDGNTGIAIDSAIHDGRYQDTYDNLKKIAETPDNQLDTQEKKDAKAVAQRLLPQMEKIKNVFEKNYQNKYDENYDLAIASAMTEYQFLSEEYEKRIGEYDSKIEELRNDIAVPSADVKEIAQLQIQVKGAEKAIENAKEELKQLNDFINSEDKSKLTRSQLQEPGYIQAGIDEIEKDISAAKERIAEIKKENEDDQLDLFVDAYTDANQQLVELETAKKLISNLSKNYAEKLAKLHTKEGKDGYIKEIKKADKERQTKVEKAAVNEAKTQDEVDAVPVETSEGKKAVTEKTKEISRENKAKTKLGEEATPETIAEEVEKDKQRESVKQSKEESFKKANVLTWWIKKLESLNKQERENFINNNDVPSEARKFLLEFSDLLEKEKEVADVTDIDKSNQEQVEIAKAIDEGKAEPIIVDEIRLAQKNAELAALKSTLPSISVKEGVTKIGFNISDISPNSKDPKKAKIATDIIEFGRDTATRKSSTKKYGEAAVAQGIPRNSGNYNSNTVAFTSTSGNNVATKEDIDNTVNEILKVLNAGGSIIMDNKTNRNSNWNKSGEGKVWEQFTKQIDISKLENISKDADFVQVRLTTTQPSASVKEDVLSIQDVLKEYTLEELKQGVNLRSLQDKVLKGDEETIKTAYNYLKANEKVELLKKEYDNIVEKNREITRKINSLTERINNTIPTKVGDTLNVYNDENASDYKVKVLEITRNKDHAILKVITAKKKEYTIRVESDGSTKSGQIDNFVFETSGENVNELRADKENLKSQLVSVKDYFDYDNAFSKLWKDYFTPTQPTTSVKLKGTINKADIEKRRLDELYEYDNTFGKDGELLFQGIETDSGIENTKEYKEKVNAINAKYDAELAALEQNTKLKPDNKVLNITPIIDDTFVIEEDKSVRSQSFKSTQESNTKGDGDFSLNFKIVDDKAVTDKSGVQSSNPSLDNSHATRHNVKTGDKVTLQLAKNSTYTPTPIYIVHEGVPMATLPSSYKEFAETIRPLLQAGEVIETTIGNDSGWIKSSNVNNVIINGKYYNVPLIDLEQIYNHRGKVGFPITLAFSTGNEYSLEGGKLSLPDATVKQLTDYFVQDYIDNVEDNQQDAKTFADNTINQIIYEINNTKLTVGQNDDITLTGLPHIIVPAPNGLWKALRLENSKLTKTHIDYILDNIVKEENLTSVIQNVNTIVYVNSDKENHSITPPPERTEGLHTAKRNKHFRLAEAGNELVIEFYSPTLETIVLTTNKRIQNNEYKVISGVTKNEQGNFVTQYGKAPQELDLMNELRNFLSTKNFNIEIDKLGLKDYVSPITNVEYLTYFDYLTSQNELAGNEFSDNNLAKSILSTTIAPVDNSPFHNVMWNYNPVTYRNKEIMQDVIAEKLVNKQQTSKVNESTKETINNMQPVKDSKAMKSRDLIKTVKSKRDKFKDQKDKIAKERKNECKGPNI